MKIVDVKQLCYITCYAYEPNDSNVLDIQIVADESNVLNISFVADGSNVPKIQDVAHGTLTKNITRRRPVLTSLSAFPVWDILRDTAHACDACDSGR